MPVRRMTQGNNPSIDVFNDSHMTDIKSRNKSERKQKKEKIKKKVSIQIDDTDKFEYDKQVSQKQKIGGILKKQQKDRVSKRMETIAMHEKEKAPNRFTNSESY